MAFAEAGLIIKWRGKGIKEKGVVGEIKDSYLLSNDNGSREHQLKGN